MCVSVLITYIKTKNGIMVTTILAEQIILRIMHKNLLIFHEALLPGLLEFALRFVQNIQSLYLFITGELCRVILVAV